MPVTGLLIRINLMRIKYLLYIMLPALCVSGCIEENRNAASFQQESSGERLNSLGSSAKVLETRIVTDISEPAGSINLGQALALGLVRNPELRAFSWDVRVSEARELQASLWPNPEIEVEAEEVGGAGPRRHFDAAETTVQLSQLIELGDKRRKRAKLASMERELAGWRYEAKRLDVFTAVAKAFTEVLAAQERRELTEELLQVSEELVNTVTERVDAGKDSPLEKTKANVSLSNIKIQHRQAVQYLEFSRKQLAATWGSKEAKFESATGQIDSLSAIPKIEELTDMIERNPDFARWSVEVDKKTSALELEKAQAVSDITLSGGMQRFNETDDNAIVFGISIGLPIFDKNQAGKLEAEYELAGAKEGQRAAYTKIKIELERAYQALSSAYAEAAELKENVLPGAEGVFEASKTGYVKGKLDYLNVLDAQRTFFNAKARYVNALASYHTAKAEIERLIGKNLDDVDNIMKTKTDERQ
jgi:cobalt-zinc-cadmium efflux system outer membrane protein